MPGQPAPGTPPEVPDEFAEAYRAAYEAALEAQSVPLRQGEHAERGRRGRPSDDEDVEGVEDLPERTRAIRIGTHRWARSLETLRSSVTRDARERPGSADAQDEVALLDAPYEGPPTAYERVRDSAWFVPVVLVVLALLLVLGAYVLGRSFAHHVAGNAGKGAAPRVVMSQDGSSHEQAVTQGPPAPGAWTGKVTQVTGMRARAGCTSPPGRDASGATVTYEAGHLTDGAVDTAWRCDGSAIGQELGLVVGRRREIGEIGLVPGYAKTDQTDGTDRYAENNRVTRVRWSLGGKQFVQSMSGSPGDRSLRVMRIPRTAAGTVTLQILAIDKGSRDTTAISEVELFATS